MSKKRKRNEDIPLGEAAEVSKDTLRISTIPASFYGGKNPEIYTQRPTKTKKKPEKPKVEKPKEPPAPTPPAATTTVGLDIPKEPIAPPKTHSKKKMILLLLFVAIIVTGIVTFFVLQSAGILNSDEPDPVPVTPVVLPPIVEEPVEPVEEPKPLVTTTTPEEPIILVPTTTPGFTIEFPRVNETAANDFDADNLSDAEEEVFGTDPGIWDTDEDGYNDGREVRNLYDPAGFAPAKIVESITVREYVNANWGYQLYYPASWDIAAINNDASELLVSAISGDYIAVYARTKPTQESFDDWFERVAPDQDSSLLTEKVSRFNVPYLLREDGLVGFIQYDDVVYVIVYYPNELQQVAYRGVMNMTLQSFRPEGTINNEIPDQVILPGTAQENAARNIVENELL